MKVKVNIPYYDKYMNKQFLKDEIVNVENTLNSDYYHIWKGNDLYLLEKKCCERVK